MREAGSSSPSEYFRFPLRYKCLHSFISMVQLVLEDEVLSLEDMFSFRLFLVCFGFFGKIMSLEPFRFCFFLILVWLPFSCRFGKVWQACRKLPSFHDTYCRQKSTVKENSPLFGHVPGNIHKNFGPREIFKRLGQVPTVIKLKTAYSVCLKRVQKERGGPVSISKNFDRGANKKSQRDSFS